MAHMLEARWFDRAAMRELPRTTVRVQDPLGAARGIAFGVLAALLFFWLPLMVWIYV
jgi:hypothetical protein